MLISLHQFRLRLDGNIKLYSNEHFYFKLYKYENIYSTLWNCAGDLLAELKRTPAWKLFIHLRRQRREMAGTKFNTFGASVTAPLKINYLSCCIRHVLHQFLVFVIGHSRQWIRIQMSEVWPQKIRIFKCLFRVLTAFQWYSVAFRVNWPLSCPLLFR